MHDEPVDLDARRGRAGLIETENRRKSLHDRGAEKAANEAGHAAVDEADDLAEATGSWVSAADKARHLLRQYARTREGRIPAQSRMIERTLNDLSVLIDTARKEAQEAGKEGED
ncbi:hypothetical protein EOI86_06460 [Hwanghaeella grinnelliae]|uniref:Uncharacterized protein n=1 Tax=Hwanghaeella grinnelliae TaxID=2500179 RepID=A0A437QWJ0_9PROT|nr:hypothetical protein [Hwanghaeella grinnelliae]RVU38905.1 hypothetical protein EOI86_06460 [Hwanghaeella grinnelliae]